MQSLCLLPRCTHARRYQAMSQEPPSPRSIDRSVPVPLAAICLKAMAKWPEDRYPRCSDLALALRRWRRPR
jgi:hypothetical protein